MRTLTVDEFIPNDGSFGPFLRVTHHLTVTYQDGLVRTFSVGEALGVTQAPGELRLRNGGQLLGGWRRDGASYVSFDDGLNAGANWCRFHQEWAPLTYESGYSLTK